MRPTLDLLLVLTLVGCNASGVIVPGSGSENSGQDSGPPLDSDDATPGDPTSGGPWQVGTIASTVRGSEGVNLPVQVWFPTEASGSLHRYDGIYAGGALDGVVATCPTPRPVVVFSHGNASVRYQSWFLTEFLASRGYIVIAPDHVGNTFQDGSLVPTGEVLIRRPVDVRDAFDGLVSGSTDPVSAWAGCVDGAAGYAVLGHSLGGYTSLAVAGAHLDLLGIRQLCVGAPAYFACTVPRAWSDRFPNDDSGDLSDPRVWAAVPIAPAGAWAFREGLADIEIPTLVIGGLTDTVTPWGVEVTPIFDGLEARPRALAGLRGAGHFAFTDLCTPGLDGCNAWSLPVPTVHTLTRTLVVEWLEATRAGAGWPDGSPSEDVVWESADP